MARARAATFADLGEERASVACSSSGARRGGDGAARESTSSLEIREALGDRPVSRTCSTISGSSPVEETTFWSRPPDGRSPSSELGDRRAIAHR
jgi:hypothetical protein